MAENSKLIILAVGGNSLIVDKTKQTVPDQYEAVLQTCQNIVPLLKAGHRVVVTHGNGPQVGFILRRAEIAAKELHMVPLDSCGADTQGAIGYQLQQAMHNATLDWPDRPPVVTVVTQVRVDGEDPGFKKPSKPIGSFMDKETADARRESDGWNMVEDSGRGFRRVVASPLPLEIMEQAAIKELVDKGFMVVAVGGGGIPVARQADGTLKGVDAVIDKDFATGLLAKNLGADLLIISTAVEKICVNFGKPDQKGIDRMTVAEAKKYIDEGQFAPGSMLPKVKAIVQFLEDGGKEALVTDPAHLEEAMAGKTGTWITP